MGEPQRLTTEERSELVAYLDQEAPPEIARDIAEKLARSLTARHEVESLERTWELLEYLPRPKASNELITRTLTLATQANLKGDRLYATTGDYARGLLKVAAGVVIAAAALGAGYAATRWVWPDPNARLARDLSIAEHFDEYQDVGSFEYLHMIDRSAHVFTATDP